MKKSLLFLLIIIFSLSFTSCFNLKNSPFYESMWIMDNKDENNQPYYHQIYFLPKHQVLLRTSYYDSTNIIEWTGTYKISSKKITFNFVDCTRFEDGKEVGKYNQTRLIKFYSGEYLYSLGQIGEEDEKEWHLQLIRPRNQIYGETKDLYGNDFEDFIKIANMNLL